MTCLEFSGFRLALAKTTNRRQMLRVLAGDNVFNDGVSAQMATVSGSAAAGFVAKLTIGIAV